MAIDDRNMGRAHLFLPLDDSTYHDFGFILELSIFWGCHYRIEMISHWTVPIGARNYPIANGNSSWWRFNGSVYSIKHHADMGDLNHEWSAPFWIHHLMYICIYIYIYMLYTYIYICDTYIHYFEPTIVGWVLVTFWLSAAEGAGGAYQLRSHEGDRNSVSQAHDYPLVN